MTGEVDASFKSEPENPEPEKCEGNIKSRTKSLQTIFPSRGVYLSTP